MVRLLCPLLVLPGVFAAAVHLPPTSRHFSGRFCVFWFYNTLDVLASRQPSCCNLSKHIKIWTSYESTNAKLCHAPVRKLFDPYPTVTQPSSEIHLTRLNYTRVIKLRVDPELDKKCTSMLFSAEQDSLFIEIMSLCGIIWKRIFIQRTKVPVLRIWSLKLEDKVML